MTKPDDLMRRRVRMALCDHLANRSVPNAAAIAADLAASWRRARCELFLALIERPNEWTTLRALAKQLGCSIDAAKERWKSLQRVAVTVEGRRVFVFRRRDELHFRNTGMVGGVKVEGGVCLHLSGDGPLTYAAERSMVVTTRKATIAHAENFAGASERFEGLAPSSEREAIAQDREEVLSGANGPQLGLRLVTGTDG